MLQREHSAILLTFIKLPVVIMNFVLSTFEWPFYTDFTVHQVYKLKNDSVLTATESVQSLYLGYLDIVGNFGSQLSWFCQ